MITLQSIKNFLHCCSKWIPKEDTSEGHAVALLSKFKNTSGKFQLILHILGKSGGPRHPHHIKSKPVHLLISGKRP
jgi:hypothetical protein